MNKSKAIAEIQKVFKALRSTKPTHYVLRKLAAAKLYELFCLAKLLDELKKDYGFSPTFKGTSFAFKGGPGMIYSGDPKFVFSGKTKSYEVYTDIEFMTLGAAHGHVGDNSDRHEIDIVIVEAGTTGYPRHDEIYLGIECKAHAHFQKYLVKQALGIRREMGFYEGDIQSALSGDANKTCVRPANCLPRSEYWLAFLAGNGSLYEKSPAFFGITFRHWHP